MNNITLVDTKERFVFSPLLYELATGRADTNEVAPLFHDLLDNTNIKHIRGQVLGVNLDKQCVELSSIKDGPVGAESIDFDQLVVALGSESNHRSDIAGVKEFCLPFYTVKRATSYLIPFSLFFNIEANQISTLGVVRLNLCSSS